LTLRALILGRWRSMNVVPVKPQTHPAEQEGGEEQAADPAEKEHQPTQREFMMDLLQAHHGEPGVRQAHDRGEHGPGHQAMTQTLDQLHDTYGAEIAQTLTLTQR